MVDYSKIHFWDYILNSNGEPIENAEIRFYLNDDPTTEANIYTSESSSSYTKTSTADIKTDNDGFFEFWIPDQWETGGYDHTQLFRLEWYKSGTVPGVIKNINPWPNAFAWEDTNTGADRNYTNKFVSDSLVNEWLSHADEIVPSASPHNLDAVDYSSGCDSNLYDKVVSNNFLKNIITLSNASSGESLSDNNVQENQNNITSWTSSGGDYYADVSHSSINTQEVLVQTSRSSNDRKINPKKIVNLNSTTTRILLSAAINLRINIQGYSSSSSSSSSSSVSSSSVSSSSVSSSSVSSSSVSSSSSSSVSSLPQRGIFGGGSSSGDTIDYITIASLGVATDFGNLTLTRTNLGATSNGANNRGVFGGGNTGSPSNVIDYITISSTGNAIDFGDLTAARRGLPGASNRTNERGVFSGGDLGIYDDTIDYITINSTGNATDFGNLTVNRNGLSGTSNGTNDRAVSAGGFNGSLSNVIDYITISSTGNATDFGDLSVTRRRLAGTSNITNERGVFGGGDPTVTSRTNVIDYITINSTGNATDFGDLTTTVYLLAATSNGVNERGVFGGGDDGSDTALIDYITINSIGNAINFGNLTVARNGLAATSDA